jgi:ABC-2 type transport system permease protein
MIAIMQRELKAYFTSSIGYVFMGVFLILAGVNFANNIFTKSADITGLFSSFQTIFLFLAPITTMRLLSEERKSKTDQLLLTSPNSVTRIVLGKYFGAMLFFLIVLSITLLFVVVLFIFGTPNIQTILLSYLAFILLVGLNFSIGLFVSSLTDNQIVSAIGTFGILFVLFISSFLTQIPNLPRIIVEILEFLSVGDKYTMFFSNLFSFEPILYFLSLTTAFLFLTIRVLDKRRWN